MSTRPHGLSSAIFTPRLSSSGAPWTPSFSQAPAFIRHEEAVHGANGQRRSASLRIRDPHVRVPTPSVGPAIGSLDLFLGRSVVGSCQTLQRWIQVVRRADRFRVEKGPLRGAESDTAWNSHGRSWMAWAWSRFRKIRDLPLQTGGAVTLETHFHI